MGKDFIISFSSGVNRARSLFIKSYLLSKEVEVIDCGCNSLDSVHYPLYGYAVGEKLSSDNWSGDIEDKSVVIEKANTGDQRLAFNSPSDEVAVSTTISGLKANTNYVAEVYVENNSDAKATIEVNTGNKTISNYTERSILNNYVQSDQKNGSKMQRMLISFTAENPSKRGIIISMIIRSKLSFLSILTASIPSTASKAS